MPERMDKASGSEKRKTPRSIRSHDTGTFGGTSGGVD